MSSDVLAYRTELYFRTHVHAALPLHAALVEALCNRSKPPLDLATVLEDIGQAYIGFANGLNAALVRRGMLGLEPDPEDADEARIEGVVHSLLSRCGSFQLNDGVVVDVRRAIDAFPVVTDALRTAVLLEADRVER